MWWGIIFPCMMEDLEPYQVAQFNSERGKMEIFIKEGESGFVFSSVSSQ